MTPRQPASLMALRAAALFCCDRRGRSTSINQWDGGQAPRFYLGRGEDSSVCRIRADVPEAVAQALLDLVAREPSLDDPQRPPEHEAAYLDLLRAGDSAAVQSGPVFRFHRDVEPAPETVLINETNADLLRNGLASWLPDVAHRQPMVAALEDGRAVSVCASVRIGSRSHEAGVETLSGYRGRGHGSRAVAGWSREAERRGVAVRFYSTSWENTASQALARRLGLLVIGADFSIP